MKEKIAKILGSFTHGNVRAEVFVPENPAFGHYSTNLALKLAGEKRRKPLELAEEFVPKILGQDNKKLFQEVEAAPPGFINFWITPHALQEEFAGVLEVGEKYGKSAEGKGKKVIVEYSSVNVAKPMHVGHLRSTIIGDALANLYEFLGYKVLRWNYIGDWGTQFGKLIAAYKLWGKKSEVEKRPIKALLSLYVRFSKEEKARPELSNSGREEFRKLEAGDSENRKLWEWFRRESLKEFREIYARLGVKFDEIIGESFYEKRFPSLIEELLKKRIAKTSEGSLIIPFGDQKLPPALIQKSDGASLYFTRELATLKDRITRHKAEKILYVVANQQSLHFEQLFAAAKLLGWNGAELHHVKFGLVLGEGKKKFATREGRMIPLEDLMEKIVKLARRVVQRKNSKLPAKQKQAIAEAVGIGALKYNDLKENRNSDIVFDWDRMLDFSGNSAPYLQYTYARLAGIGRKAGKMGKFDLRLLEEEPELRIIRHIFEFPHVLSDAVRMNLTNGIALYLYELANFVNRFYESTPIIKDEYALRRNARRKLIEAAMGVLERGLRILGVKALKRI